MPLRDLSSLSFVSNGNCYVLWLITCFHVLFCMPMGTYCVWICCQISDSQQPTTGLHLLPAHLVQHPLFHHFCRVKLSIPSVYQHAVKAALYEHIFVKQISPPCLPHKHDFGVDVDTLQHIYIYFCILFTRLFQSFQQELRLFCQTIKSYLKTVYLSVW